MIKASKREELQENLDDVCAFYHNNLDKELLHSQLQIFRIRFQMVKKTAVKVCKFDLKRYFLSLSPGQASLLSQVRRLLQLILVMPATNATPERSFSALCPLRNYLRTTMAQERLNHLMLMHVHKQRTEILDLKCVLNDFVAESERCNSIFARY